MPSAHIFFLHGDDPAGITERVKTLCAALGDASMADLNLTTLDGRICDENAIRNAALSIPFLADHRLVIVQNAQARFGQDSQKKRFSALLDEIPPSTQLVLVIPDEPAWLKDAGGRWERGWKLLSASHFLVKWAKENSSKVSDEGFRLPDQKEMPGWILAETKKQGGQFTQEAATELADFTGSDTQVARLEITKLLNYVNFERAVTGEDVDNVSIHQNQVTVFQLNDAIANGEKGAALHLLQQVLETDDPIRIFASLVGHFRRLLLIKDALQHGGTSDSISSDFRLYKKNLDSVLQQCRRFNMEELKKVYLKLADLDFEIKNGITPADLAIELFLMDLKSAKT
jgi:DNA polymerase III subunit delta